MNSLVISDECIENCLEAIAAATINTRENAAIAFTTPRFLEHVVSYIRHSNPSVRISSSKILTNLNKFHKLPMEISS